jgi:hypothetical protein
VIRVQPRPAPTVSLQPMRSAVPTWLLVLAACTVGPGGSFPDGGATAATTVSSTAQGTASEGSDGGTLGSDPASSSSADAGTTAADTTGDPTDPSTGDAVTGDASTSPVSGSESSDSGAGTPLDPLLDIPDVGEQCDYPGDLQSCPGIAVCRFATAEYGLCESCDACGNLNAPCAEGTDCDILFSCYAGHCTNFCTLGTFECGPVEACLDVGHPTRGVCDPFA